MIEVSRVFLNQRRSSMLITARMAADTMSWATTRVAMIMAGSTGLSASSVGACSQIAVF